MCDFWMLKYCASVVYTEMCFAVMPKDAYGLTMRNIYAH